MFSGLREDDEQETETEEHEFQSPEQISDELVTLSLLPSSRWQNLLSLDVIKVPDACSFTAKPEGTHCVPSGPAWTNLGPVHAGRGAPCNMHRQIMEHTEVNGSVHTGCTQHQRVCRQICMQICLHVLCEWGPTVWLYVTYLEWIE